MNSITQNQQTVPDPDNFMSTAVMFMGKLFASGMVEYRERQAAVIRSWEDKTYEDESGKRFVYHGNRPDPSWKKVPRNPTS